METFVIIAAVAGIAVGFFTGMVILRKNLEKKSAHIVRDAISEAEMIKKDKVLEAKEKFLQLKSEHDRQVNERNKMIAATENRLKQKELTVNQRLEETQRKQKETQQMRDNLTVQIDSLAKKEVEVEKMHRSQIEQLGKISGYSALDAKKEQIGRASCRERV